jgi:hypothetical protein
MLESGRGLDTRLTQLPQEAHRQRSGQDRAIQPIRLRRAVPLLESGQGLDTQLTRSPQEVRRQESGHRMSGSGQGLDNHRTR